MLAGMAGNSMSYMDIDVLSAFETTILFARSSYPSSPPPKHGSLQSIPVPTISAVAHTSTKGCQFGTSRGRTPVSGEEDQSRNTPGTPKGSVERGSDTNSLR